ncbi:TIGR00180 family glycosyltransferase [Aurantimonas sp. MSK8Z-1]|uniref:TIGR00180 family glycosyltransferase n=1 Tax=Mangrovibrevibacter kandeliae TaxID=2968473 RepID=UPI00222E938B|nr:TIGR00180 family glycosyltransferase [Aurantimonas sp. MSK8Z-1]MCW4117004.1 TIGR00180 family glycosyltransferase [Aurantimonas sp. MSK8Z-1]
MSDDYTLVIPTYNRPESLGRLLRYLEAMQFEFPVLVLDSSRDELRERNRVLVDKLDLKIERIDYPDDMHPFDKFREGVRSVTTSFCGLCADDDVLIVDGLRESIAFLRNNPDYSVAHGYYFQFHMQPAEFHVTNITYYTPDYGMADPLQRLHALMRHYQALTYGTYRTEVLNRVFDAVRPVESILARELLSSALAVVHGKVARLPLIFHGRNLGPSVSYQFWHPLEWLIREPTGLMREYLKYRNILVGDVLSLDGEERDVQAVDRVVDLIHMQYLVRHAPDEAFDHIIASVLAGQPTEEIFGAGVITHGLIRKAADFVPLDSQHAAGPAVAAPSAGQADPPLSFAPAVRAEGAARVTPPKDVRLAGLRATAREALIRIEPHAPRFVAAVVAARRALMPPAATPAPAPVAAATPASTPAAEVPASPLVRASPVRRYVFGPAFVSPPAHYGVQLPETSMDRLTAALDGYR